MIMKKNNEIIDMDKAIKLLKTSRPTFYRWLRSGKIKGMKVGRQWRFYKEDIDRFLKGEDPRIEIRGDLAPLIEKLTKEVKKQKAVPDFPENCENIDKAVTLMVTLAASMTATDIHITPHKNKDDEDIISVLRFRIMGTLRIIAEFDNRLQKSIIEKWKMMAQCDINEDSHPQDGRIICKFGENKGTVSEKEFDMRVAFLPTTLGESLTARVLNKKMTSSQFNLDNIDFSKDNVEKIKKAIKQPLGIVMVCAPAGHGKTTTLYSALNELASPQKKIVTIENPVEIIIPWTTQTQINPEKGITYQTEFRSCMRTDLDVLMLGEIDNEKVLNNCLQASLTGHLVLTTMHANTASMALSKLMEMEKNLITLTDSIKVIVSQKLLRGLCPHCKEKKALDEETEKVVSAIVENSGGEWSNNSKEYYVPVGCEKCSGGYKGVIPVEEVLTISSTMKKAILNNVGEEELQKLAIESGMNPMVLYGLEKAINGDTSINEIIRCFE